MRILNVVEMEQKYSLEQVKKMAREKRLSTTGTKREIIRRLVTSGEQPQSLPQTELTPSQKAHIQPNWGYYVEVSGYLKGDFRRSKTEVPVKILELRYAGVSDDVLVEFEDGKRGLADIRSLKSITGILPQTIVSDDADLLSYYKVPPEAY